MEAEVVAAWVAAGSAFVVAIIGWIQATLARRGERTQANELALLKSRLDGVQKERDARRDYEYEALKRLYEDVEPLFFQLRRASKLALERIQSLGKNAAEGYLGQREDSWLRPQAYMNHSTLYRLLVPPAIVELIGRRLTNIDLALDSRLAQEYQLAEFMAGSMRLDFRMAELAPQIRYEPDKAPDDHGVEPDLPSHLRRQGVYSGWLEQAIDSMLVKEPNTGLRVLSYAEFEKLVQGDSRKGAPFRRLDYLLRFFDPRSEPVLWRVMLLNAHLYVAISDLHQSDSREAVDPERLVRALSENERVGLVEVRYDDLDVVEQFVRSQVPALIQ